MSLSKMYALVIVFSCRRTFLYLNFLHYVFFHYVNLGSQWGFLGSTVDKNLPANAGDTEMWVRALASGSPLEKEIATHSSILAWKIPRTQAPVGYSP